MTRRRRFAVRLLLIVVFLLDYCNETNAMNETVEYTESADRETIDNVTITVHPATIVVQPTAVNLTYITSHSTNTTSPQTGDVGNSSSGGGGGGGGKQNNSGESLTKHTSTFFSFLLLVHRLFLLFACRSLILNWRRQRRGQRPTRRLLRRRNIERRLLSQLATENITSF